MYTFIIIAAVLFTSAAAFTKRTNCGIICSAGFCTDDKKEDCNPAKTEFVEKDNDCYCCDECVTTNFEVDCSGVNCQYPEGRPTAETCAKQGLKFRPIDKFTCCDTCQERELGKCDLVRCASASEDSCKEKGKLFVPADGKDICYLGICSRVFCISQSEDECKKKGQDFVPRDGVEVCCDVCRKKKE